MRAMLNVVESTPMLSSLREAIKDLPRIRDALNNETATDTFFAPSNKRSNRSRRGEGTPISRGPLEDVFKRRNQSARRRGPRRADERLNWGQLRAKAAKGEFFRRLSRESLRIHPRRWK